MTEHRICPNCGKPEITTRIINGACSRCRHRAAIADLKATLRADADRLLIPILRWLEDRLHRNPR